MLMSLKLLWLPFVFAGLDWIAVAKRWVLFEYVTKPAAIGALLIWMWLVLQEGAGSGTWSWFVIGVFLSLIGDVMLMLPREQFIAGLIAFFLAHVAYIVGLNQSPLPINLASGLIVLMVGFTALRLYRAISKGLAESGKNRLRLPVLVYSLMISLMLISALLTLVKDVWSAVPALIVSAGAISFFVSDTLLAWNRFVAPLSKGKLKVRISYHLGQIALVVGAGLHYLVL